MVIIKGVTVSEARSVYVRPRRVVRRTGTRWARRPRSRGTPRPLANRWRGPTANAHSHSAQDSDRRKSGRELGAHSHSRDSTDYSRRVGNGILIRQATSRLHHVDFSALLFLIYDRAHRWGACFTHDFKHSLAIYSIERLAHMAHADTHADLRF